MLGRAVQLSFPVQASGEELIRDSCTAQHYLEMCLEHPSGNPGMDPGIEEIRAQNAAQGSYLWGNTLHDLMIQPPPHLKVLNLEYAVTRTIDNEDLPMYKAIRYHMHSDNFETILRGFCHATHQPMSATSTAVTPAPVVINCANNHGLDYGRKAFEQETLPLFERVQDALNVHMVGCGRNWEQAARPAIVPTSTGTIVRVFGFSAGCSGTPNDWWATATRSGLVGLPALYTRNDVEAAMDMARKVFSAVPQSSDETVPTCTVASIHWGPNWALRGENESELRYRREFAHRLIDECGVDLIYGHSSHHVRGMEVYHSKLILYGAGDIINDYEGFENAGEERYNRLGGIFLVDVDPTNGDFQELRIIPMRMNRLRLERFVPSSKIWQPRQRRLLHNPQYIDEFCEFVNGLSKVDAGSTNALIMKTVVSDPQVPGGPILKST